MVFFDLEAVSSLFAELHKYSAKGCGGEFCIRWLGVTGVVDDRARVGCRERASNVRIRPEFRPDRALDQLDVSL